MAFNLYFAGWGSQDADEYLRSKRANRLLSWVNENRVIEWWKNDNLGDKLFIDSGAFSIAHSNATVDIKDYISFIKHNSEITTWAELDVIPYPILNTKTAHLCSDKSWENYVYLKNHIFDRTILPIYHFGESKNSLLRILNTPVNGELANYIGVGGRHGVSVEEQIKYFNNVFATIQHSDNPNVKVHAFGITIPSILEQFPFYSSDSTSWLQAGINGIILTENLQKVIIGDRNNFGKLNIQGMSGDSVEFLRDMARKRGYSYDDLRSDYKLRLRYNIDILLDWEKNYIYKGPKVFKSQKLF